MTFAGYNVGQSHIKKGLVLLTDPAWQSHNYVKNIAGWRKQIDDTYRRLVRAAERSAAIATPKTAAAEVRAPSHMVDGVRLKRQLEKKYRGVSGRLDDGELEKVGEHWGGHTLHPAAAAALRQLDAAFHQRFGDHLELTDSYRSFDQQVATKARKGRLAATPGTSNHGWGLAVDLASNINIEGSQAHEWMEENAPRYGWFNPGWAEDGKGIEEPWHWELIGSGDAKKL